MARSVMTAVNWGDIAKQGHVLVKENVLGGILSHWRRRWLALIRRSSRGPLRLIVYHQDQVGLEERFVVKVIALADFTFITMIPPAVCQNAIVINFSTNNRFRFCLDSNDECERWYHALITTCSTSLAGSCSTPELFNVSLMPTSLLPFDGECLLQVTSKDLCLIDSANRENLLAAWPLNTIRQYGYPREEKFTFIAGRSSPTGEGLFIFSTSEAQLIYRKIHIVTQSMADACRIMQHCRSLEMLNVRSSPQHSASDSQTPVDSTVALRRWEKRSMSEAFTMQYSPTSTQPKTHFPFPSHCSPGQPPADQRAYPTSPKRLASIADSPTNLPVFESPSPADASRPHPSRTQSPSSQLVGRDPSTPSTRQLRQTELSSYSSSAPNEPVRPLPPLPGSTRPRLTIAGRRTNSLRTDRESYRSGSPEYRNTAPNRQRSDSTPGELGPSDTTYPNLPQ